VVRVAFLVNAMTASHENNSIRGRKHVFPADRTVALSGTFDATMRVLDRDGYAYATSLFEYEH
jgi:hypothetical protein